MNKYGIVAINAIQALQKHHEAQPLMAWNSAATLMFGEGTESQRKGCPRNAFIGLCEVGLVKGISKGTYVKKSGLEKNKEYAVKAVEMLSNTPELAKDKRKLWNEVVEGVEKKHNSQMDVVLALWNTELISN